VLIGAIIRIVLGLIKGRKNGQNGQNGQDEADGTSRSAMPRRNRGQW
jgi:hypothetical protein